MASWSGCGGYYTVTISGSAFTYGGNYIRLHIHRNGERLDESWCKYNDKILWWWWWNYIVKVGVRNSRWGGQFPLLWPGLSHTGHFTNIPENHTDDLDDEDDDGDKFDIKRMMCFKAIDYAHPPVLFEVFFDQIYHLEEGDTLEVVATLPDGCFPLILSFPFFACPGSSLQTHFWLLESTTWKFWPRSGPRQSQAEEKRANKEDFY